MTSVTLAYQKSRHVSVRSILCKGPASTNMHHHIMLLPWAAWSAGSDDTRGVTLGGAGLRPSLLPPDIREVPRCHYTLQRGTALRVHTFGHRIVGLRGGSVAMAPFGCQRGPRRALEGPRPHARPHHDPSLWVMRRVLPPLGTLVVACASFRASRPGRHPSMCATLPLAIRSKGDRALSAGTDVAAPESPEAYYDHRTDDAAQPRRPGWAGDRQEPWLGNDRKRTAHSLPIAHNSYKDGSGTSCLAPTRRSGSRRKGTRHQDQGLAQDGNMRPHC